MLLFIKLQVIPAISGGIVSIHPTMYIISFSRSVCEVSVASLQSAALDRGEFHDCPCHHHSYEGKTVRCLDEHYEPAPKLLQVLLVVVLLLRLGVWLHGDTPINVPHGTYAACNTYLQ